MNKNGNEGGMKPCFVHTTVCSREAGNRSCESYDFI